MFGLKTSFTLLIILLSITSYADSYYDNIDISGYVTQGLIHTSDNNYFGDSDDSAHLNFFDASLLLEIVVSDRVSFSSKATYRSDYTLRQDAFAIDHALIDILLHNENSWTVRGRAGRVKVYGGLYNSLRDSPLTWPTALMPEPYYSHKTLNLLLALDGINLFVSKQFDDFTLSLDIAAGEDHIEKEAMSDYSLFGLAETENIRMHDLINADLRATSSSQNLSFGISHLSTNTDFKGSIPNIMHFEEPYDWTLTSLYAQYFFNAWQVDIEFSQIRLAGDQEKAQQNLEFPSGISSCIFGSKSCRNLVAQASITPETINSRAAYINVFYHFDTGLTVYGGFSGGYRNSKDKYGRDLDANPLIDIPGHSQYLKTWSTGLQYSYKENWLFSAGFYKNTGSLSLSSADNNIFDQKKRWNMIAAHASYYF